MRIRVCRIQVLTFVLVALVGAAPARAQTLAVQGDHFAVNGQGKFLLFASYFDAMHASSQTLDIDFQYLREKGFDGIRIFPNWAQGCGARVAAPGFYTATGLVPASDPLWTRFIDILNRADGITFDEAAAAGESFELDGRRIPVIGRDALLKNKRAANRPQDLADVDALDRLVKPL